MIYWIITWLVISEIFYLWICSRETKKELKKEWINYKLMCFVCSLFCVGLIWFVVELFKDYPSQTLIGASVTIGIILLFIINKHIGIKLAKKK